MGPSLNFPVNIMTGERSRSRGEGRRGAAREQLVGRSVS